MIKLTEESIPPPSWNKAGASPPLASLGKVLEGDASHQTMKDEKEKQPLLLWRKPQWCGDRTFLFPTA